MASNDKIDLYTEHKTEYVAKKKPALVTVRPATYLTVTGKGAPGSKAFEASIGALYGVAWTIKMAKKMAGCDYKVCKLEALYWGKRQKGDFSTEPKHTWNWKLMIRTPGLVKKRDVTAALEALREKGKVDAGTSVELERISEGQCVQILHQGPYDEVGRSVQLMHEFVTAEGLRFDGTYHEIYLSDPRRAAPEKLRTILREPVA